MSKVTVCDGCGITIPEINHGKHFVTTEYDMKMAITTEKKKSFMDLKL